MTNTDDALFIVSGVMLLFFLPGFAGVLLTLITGDIILRWNMIFIVFASAGLIAGLMVLGAWLDGV